MTLTTLLLAGGLSGRMGRDKATLPLQGEPLWARQLGLLRELEPTALWVSARTVPAWLPPDVPSVLDQPPSRGPLSGVASALVTLQSSHLLVLAIDLPRMTAGHLRKLIEMAHPGRGVVPLNGEMPEPLAAIYPKEAAPLAQAALASGDVSMRSFVTRLQQNKLLSEYPVTLEERGLYLNFNQPGDLVA